MDSARKRGRSDAANVNGEAAGSKRSRETDSSQLGIGSKSKPCTKFFSTAGCPFGDGCHFQHYVPGGLKALSKVNNSLGTAHVPPVTVNGPSTFKSRICNHYNSAEGCRFGDKCRFAHGEKDLGHPISLPPHDRPALVDPSYGRPHDQPFQLDPYARHLPPSNPAPASFGASATAKISVDASLAGAIIGKGGAHTKHISRVSGARLSIKDHSMDPKLKNIELEGTLDQIKEASSMVTELILTFGNAASGPAPVAQRMGGPVAHAAPANNYKTKICQNFPKGSCNFGDKCHFAHGEGELR